MRFKMAGKVYTFTSLTEPSIMDYLVLTMETEALGRRWTADTAAVLAEEIAECKDAAERSAHPDMMWLLALVVWSTKCVERRMVDTGLRPERVPFGDLVDVSLDDLTFLDEPEDHKPAAVRPTKARAGSARATKRPAAARKPAARTTSKTPLTDAS